MPPAFHSVCINIMNFYRDMFGYSILLCTVKPQKLQYLKPFEEINCNKPLKFKN